MLICLPEDALWVMNRLEQAGFRAYVVGGCVRDSLLSRAPKDWDICTDARPEQTQAVFAGCHVIETGLKHGTLTVMRSHTPYEVTTFRVDGAYTDHRHPDSVAFVTDVRADLMRRDFTINAMAYRPSEGLVDAFGGQEDLRRGLIRCVGEPEERFGEDALRILRALRFAAVYGFQVEEGTARAIRCLYPTLAQVAAERIRVEVSKLLCGERAADVLAAFPEVARFVLPGLPEGPSWAETLRLLPHQPPEEAPRMAALYAPGPAAPAEKAARAARATEGLKTDKATAQTIQALLLSMGEPLAADRTSLLHLLNRHGPDQLRQILAWQTALAAGTPEAQRLRAVDAALAALLKENPCYSLKHLAVNGQDLQALGLRGKQVGERLQSLLEAVMNGKAENNKGELIKMVKPLIRQSEE